MSEPLNVTPANIAGASQIQLNDAGGGDEGKSFTPTEELISPKEVKPGEKSFSLDEFTANADVTPPKERAKVKEEKEVELDEEDEEVEVEEEKDKEKDAPEEDVEDDPIKDADVDKNEKQHGNTKRDYTGLSASQIKLLKKLDNPRFEKISTELRVLNEAAQKSVQLAVELEAQKKLLQEGGIPNQWYEHPEAYQLSKEFRELSSAYARQDAIEQFYEQQLLNNKSGNDFYVIQGFDAQGNPQYSAAQKASNQGEIFLQRELSKATQLKAQLEGRSENLRTNYQQHHQQAAGAVQKEVQGYVDRLDKNLKFEEKDVQALTSALPQMYRDHPLAKAFCQLGALNFSQARYIQKLTGEQAQKVKLEADKKLAGPRVGKIPAQPSGAKLGNRKDVYSLDEFLQDS
jgi:hypothetical protein